MHLHLVDLTTMGENSQTVTLLLDRYVCFPLSDLTHLWYSTVLVGLTVSGLLLSIDWGHTSSADCMVMSCFPKSERINQNYHDIQTFCTTNKSTQHVLHPSSVDWGWHCHCDSWSLLTSWPLQRQKCVFPTRQLPHEGIAPTIDGDGEISPNLAQTFQSIRQL